MIISDPLQFWFIHNPKVAGSSVRKALLQYNTSKMELWHQRHIPALDRVVDMSHLAALDVPHVVHVPDHYFRFGFVRNPYSRFFSACREHARQHGLVLSTPKQISEFVLTRLTHTSVRFDWQYSHFCPQHYYFYAGRKCVADFIGCHENIHADWKKILTLLELPYQGHELGNERFTGEASKAPEEWLSYEALKRVNSLYAKDWLLFDHLFTEKREGELETGSHGANVHNFRTVEGRVTFYGEPPNLSLPEKVGFLTAEVERLSTALRAINYEAD